MKTFSTPCNTFLQRHSYLSVGSMILLALISSAFGQVPAFEVSSIKPLPPLDSIWLPPGQMSGCVGGPGTKDPGWWTCENMSLANLIRIAFDLKVYQFGNWYSELRNERFSIRAKVPDGASKEQLRQMQQNLLSERFGLKFHFEKKETQGYELVVTNTGPKFKESKPEPPEGSAVDLPAALWRPTIGQDGLPTMPPDRTVVGITRMGARGQWVRTTLADFAAMLVSWDMAGKPVIDGTELKGKYDLSLQWAPEPPTSRIGSLAAAGPENTLPAAPEASGPNFFTALQEQLGLKLQPKKVTIEILVIDHIEKTPTEN